MRTVRALARWATGLLVALACLLAIAAGPAGAQTPSTTAPVTADTPSACVSSIERPECAKGTDVSVPQLVLMGLVLGGMAFIVVRIAVATRRRTRAKAEAAELSAR